jgi:hypothetical protein
LTIGVDGLSSSSTGAGVRGRNDNNGGVAGFGVYGVYGEGYTGIIGRANGRDIGTRAATFYGAVHVDGSFSVAKGTKNFRIDHPLDPENQYLQHAAIESSEVLNQYMGNVVLDANGEAVVELPVWFEAINTNFRYQLTPIGPTTSVLYIAEEIQGNRFKIGGGTAGQKVSWLVAATRNDAYMQANPFQVEMPKPADKRGTYLYPEGYGQPESRGEDYEDQQRIRQMQDDAPLAPEEAPGQ